jgi:hypothetical protein
MLYAFFLFILVPERTQIIEDLSSGHPRHRLLYGMSGVRDTFPGFLSYLSSVTPEKLTTGDFIKLVSNVHANGELNRLVVDEVNFARHLISQHTDTAD